MQIYYKSIPNSVILSQNTFNIAINTKRHNKRESAIEVQVLKQTKRLLSHQR